MLKIDHEYTDWDDKKQTETLYFNLTKSELILDDKIQEMETQVKAVQSLASGPERTLTPDEIRQIFRLVVFVMKLSYGIRSEDGRHFNKKDVWSSFESTSVYDSFVFSLFEDTDKAVSFVYGVLPKELVEEAQEQAKKLEQPDLFEKQTVVVGEVTSSSLKDGRPAYIREDREPTKQELTSMSKDELLVALSRKNQQ